MIPASLFALSFATLGYELLLARWLAVAHWDSLAFLVIGVAMFGFAAGGVLFHAAPERRRLARPVEDAAGLCVAGSAALAGSFLAAKRLPLDWLLLPAQPVQVVWLAATCLMLSFPFVATGLASCLAYAAMPARSGTVSAVSLAGSALGAVAVPLLLSLAEEGRLVALFAGGALAPALLLPRARTGGRSGRRLVAVPAAGAALAVCLAAGAFAGGGRLFAVVPSPWQTLPQLELLPGTKVVARWSGAWGRVDEVESRHLRFAPGLSLSVQEPVPIQRGLVADGDSLTVLHDPGEVAFARSTPPFAGYVLAGSGAAPQTESRRILVVHADGGLGTACALASLPAEITVACENAGLARRMAEWYATTAVSVVADNPRSLLARGGAPWDLIHLERWGPSVAGMAGLSESALLTVDALVDCWRRLAPSGVLVVSRRLVLPPSDSVRLFAAAVEALDRAGVAEPSEHLAVVRSVDSLSLLASRRPLRGELLARLRVFADDLGFDLDWFPGIAAADADRYQRFERPLFFEAYSTVLADRGFLRRYPLDVAPQTDDRPFPNRVLRWTKIRQFTALAGGRLHGLLLSTELVGGASLAVSLAAGAALLGSTALRRRRPAAGDERTTPRRLLVACGLVGAGFMFAEICLVDAVAILFPGPLLPLALALGGMLGFGSLGGLATERFGLRKLGPTLAVVGAVLIATGLLLLPAVRLALKLPTIPRALACVAMIALPSFLLGMPFPLILGRLSASGDRALAWAANGAASVVASSSAALVAAGAGLSLLALLAAAGYLAALAAAGAAGRRGVESPPRLTPAEPRP